MRTGAIEDIKTGEWTLLVVVEDEPPEHWFERRCYELRYVFLKREEDAVARYNVSDFYKHTAGIQEAFPLNMSDIGKCPINRILVLPSLTQKNK